MARIEAELAAVTAQLVAYQHREEKVRQTRRLGTAEAELERMRQTRLPAFESHLRLLKERRNPSNTSLKMKISRTDVLGSMHGERGLGRTVKAFMKDTCVKFFDGVGKAEVGIDDGGLSAELFSSVYWKELFHGSASGDEEEEEKEDEERLFRSLFRSSSSASNIFLPQKSHNNTGACACIPGECPYYDVGRVLLKCVINMHVLPQRYLPRCVIQYLVSPEQAEALLTPDDTEVGVLEMLAELEAFDTVFARSLDNMYRKHLDDTCWDDIDDSGCTEPITNANKGACIIAKIRDLLLNDIRGALDCLRAGFRLERYGKGSEEQLRQPLIDITPHLDQWTADELMDLIYGKEILTVEHFVKNVCFADGVADRIKEHFRQYLRSSNERALRDLLRFATGSESFNHRTTAAKRALNVVEVADRQLPAAHTCEKQLVLWDEEDFDDFKLRLQESVKVGLSGGFQDE